MATNTTDEKIEDAKIGDANGKTITLGLTRQRTNPCCLDFLQHFPELADLLHRNERLLKNVDRALAQREITTKAFSEAVKRRRNTAGSPGQNPHGVRN